MITAKVICDSINPAGDRITTGLWTFPRFILAEVNTHRMLAKNTASSRAIPVEKMVAAVRENPAVFEQYGRANKGMSAQELMHPIDQEAFEKAWKEAGLAAATFAEDWGKDVAKQIINRILEPWLWVTQIVTATDWANMFALRAHPAVQPEFQVLAYRWLDAYLKSKPVKMQWGQWHLPFVDSTEAETVEEWGFDFRKQSVARCARVSYTRHDAEDTIDSCSKLHDRLLESGHMSPFEHQAQAIKGSMTFPEATDYHGCYKGWRPYRKYLPNENRTNVDLHALLAAKPDWITL